MMAAVAGLPPSLMITPQEQLELLASAKVSKYLQKKQLGLPHTVDDLVSQSALRIILKPVKRSESTLFDRAVEHLIELSPLPPSLTHWYTGLERLDALPGKIPALPPNIEEILNRECPIYSDRNKPDGTSYKIRDTHFLSLIPEEFGTVRKLEGILKSYGEKNYPEKQNPLRIRKIWEIVHEQHADTAFAPSHWVLMTKDVLPMSRNSSWDEQRALVKDLSRNAGEEYEIPTLQQMFAAIHIHKVATGESLYQTRNEQNDVQTYSRVQETLEFYPDHHVLVGGSSPFGMNVCHDSGKNRYTLGIAALQKF